MNQVGVLLGLLVLTAGVEVGVGQEAAGPVVASAGATVAQAVAAQVPPPEAPPAEPAHVERGKARDPFRPFTLDLLPPEPIQLTPLQRYDLGQLTVVATVWELSPPRAMVEDSVGMGYILTLGTPIGRNRGLVTAIEPQRVVVEERVLDYYGREQVNRIVMETPKEEGPSQPVREQK